MRVGKRHHQLCVVFFFKILKLSRVKRSDAGFRCKFKIEKIIEMKLKLDL